MNHASPHLRGGCRSDATFWGLLGAVVVLAFAVRLAYLHQIEPMPFFYHLVGDATAYWIWAGQILEGDWIGTEPFYQAPAYPYVLAVIRWLAGDDLWRVRVVQIVLGSVSCGLLALAGRRWISPPAGLCAGFLVAVYGPALFFDGLIQKATLGFFLMSLLLCLLGWMSAGARPDLESAPAQRGGTLPYGRVSDTGVGPSPESGAARRLGRQAHWLRFIGLAFPVGIVLALLALTREQSLLLAGVVVLWLALSRGPKVLEPPRLSPPPLDGVGHPHAAPSPLEGAGHAHSGLRTQDSGLTSALSTPTGGQCPPYTLRPLAVAACLTGMLAVLGPVAYRNYRVCGEVALTTFQAGPNFYIGNHVGATGRYVPLQRGREAPPFERRDAAELAEAALGRALSPRAVSDYWFGQAWAYIRANPVRWARLLLYKWMLVWNAYEVSDTESYTLYSHLSWLLAVCGGVDHFGVLCPLAVLGIAATAGRWRNLWVLYAMIAVIAGGVAVFYVFGRYRYPLVPLLAIFAGAGLCELRGIIRVLGAPRATGLGGEGASRRWAGVVLAAAAAVVVNLRFNPEQRLDAMAYANLGAVLGRQARYDDAIYFLEQALSQAPDSVETHFNLALAYGFKGDYEQALAHLNEAKALDPQLAAVDTQMGACYETLGDREAAIHHYEQALATDPNDEQARAGWERLRRHDLPPREELSTNGE